MTPDRPVLWKTRWWGRDIDWRTTPITITPTPPGAEWLWWVMDQRSSTDPRHPPATRSRVQCYAQPHACQG